MGADSPDLYAVALGGGLAGLAFATEAVERGPVAVLEPTDRVGGHLRSQKLDGWLCESAAATVILPAPGLSTLIATSGASTDLVTAQERGRRRWIYYGDDGLLELPSSPPTAVKTPILSARGKLRALCEPFARRPPGGEESVAAFLSRRFGAEAADRLAQPVVSGIFAGDATRLSLDAAFPLLRELEAAGGVLRGGIRRMRGARKSGAPRPALHSFRDGMESLPRRLSAVLGDAVHLGSTPEGISRTEGGWRVGDLTARHLVLCCPPAAAAAVVDDLDAELAGLLRSVQRAPVAVAHLGYPATALGATEGFGFLAHPSSGLGILGAVMDSVVFPGRAPDGHHLLRVIMGGATRPDLLDADDAALLETAVSDLDRVLGTGTPVFTHVVRQTPGIPQYDVGHAGTMAAVTDRLAGHPGLDVTGWAYRGVGVSGVVADAVALARGGAGG